MGRPDDPIAAVIQRAIDQASEESDRREASLADLVAATDAGLDAEMRAKLAHTMRELSQIKAAAEAGFSYDQMLERGNAAGEELVMGAVNGLIDQTRSIERVVAALGLDQIEFEGSDSLDDPDAVFQ